MPPQRSPRPARGQSASDRLLRPRIPADLRSTELDGWDDESYEGVLLSGVGHGRPPIDLSGCRLADLSLVGSSLAGSRLVDVEVDGCDMAGIDLENASLTRVVLRGARLSGAQAQSSRWRDVHLVDCVLDGVNLRAVRGERVRFERCRLVGADLSRSGFTGVAWWDCDLTDADVSGLTIERAQLHGSVLAGVRGAQSLAPVSIDPQQEAVFAALLLEAAGIVVGDRTNDE